MAVALASTDTTAEIEKVTDPTTGEELTAEQIDTEVQARTNALQFATKEEIQKCLEYTQPSSMAHAYFSGFNKNDQARISRHEVKSITTAKTTVDSSILRAGINKNDYLRDLGLNIDVEKDGTKIIAWVLQSTRVAILKDQEIPAATIELHDLARAIRDSFEPNEAAILDCLIDQYIGLPLNHLAIYAEIEKSEILDSISKINKAFNESKISTRIRVRNGIVILGAKNGLIEIVDNAETRKNLFPKKQSKETQEAKLERLERELQLALEEIAAEKAKTSAAEARAAKSETENSEANAALRAKITTTEKDLETAQKQIETLNSQLQTAESTNELAAAQHKEEIAALQKRIEELQTQLAKLTEPAVETAKPVVVAAPVPAPRPTPPPEPVAPPAPAPTPRPTPPPAPAVETSKPVVAAAPAQPPANPPSARPLGSAWTVEKLPADRAPMFTPRTGTIAAPVKPAAAPAPAIAPTEKPAAAAAPVDAKKQPSKSLSTIIAENAGTFGGTKTPKFLIAKTLAEATIAGVDTQFMTLAEIATKAGLRFSEINAALIITLEFNLSELHLKIERSTRDAATTYRIVKMAPGEKFTPQYSAPAPVTAAAKPAPAGAPALTTGQKPLELEDATFEKYITYKVEQLGGTNHIVYRIAVCLAELATGSDKVTRQDIMELLEVGNSVINLETISTLRGKLAQIGIRLIESGTPPAFSISWSSGIAAKIPKGIAKENAPTTAPEVSAPKPAAPAQKPAQPAAAAPKPAAPKAPAPAEGSRPIANTKEDLDKLIMTEVRPVYMEKSGLTVNSVRALATKLKTVQVTSDALKRRLDIYIDRITKEANRTKGEMMSKDALTVILGGIQ